MPVQFGDPINASTRYCAVLGHPINHSASPAMQNAAFAELDLNWRYLAFDVAPENLREVILGAKRMKFLGLNLTVPHKLLAFEYVDALDESAKKWGAVNTIRFETRDTDGQWRPLHEFTGEVPEEVRSHGFNTDAGAIVRALREDLGVQLRGASVLLLGAGGAGRVAALKLAAENVAHLYLVNRTESKAAAIAGEITKAFPQTKVTIGYPSSPIDVVLNATSLGLKAGDPLPLDTTRFPIKQAQCVYDMIYRPAETPLLKLAREAGCRTANGLGMLLYQGAEALEIWTGRKAPIEVMRRALRRNIYGD